MELRESDRIDSGLAKPGPVFCNYLLRVGVTIRLAGVYELELIVSNSTWCITAGAYSSDCSEEAAGGLRPVVLNVFTPSAAAELSLIAALPAALIAHRMDMLTTRCDRGMVAMDQNLLPCPRVTH